VKDDAGKHRQKETIPTKDQILATALADALSKALELQAGVYEQRHADHERRLTEMATKVEDAGRTIARVSVEIRVLLGALALVIPVVGLWIAWRK
jgi:hypothetical protein